jgi:hypothetical protein
MASWEHVRRDECICYRNELNAGAECVMNCCVHNCRNEEWCDDTRSDGKTKCRQICGECYDQGWYWDCIKKIIETACRSTLSFPPLPAFKPADTAGKINGDLQRLYTQGLYDWEDAALSCHVVECRKLLLSAALVARVGELRHNHRGDLIYCRCYESTCLLCGGAPH